jgi:hypothetical protein
VNDRERALKEAQLDFYTRERDWRRIFLGPHEDAVPFLMSLLVFVDSRTGDTISFEHLREPLEDGEVWLDTDGITLRCKGWDGPANSRGGEKTWRWQRYIVDRRLNKKRRIDLKGRQIGDTWINLGVDVAKAILMPGTDSLLFRQTEKEAIDNVQRWWTIFESIPPWVLERVPAGKKTGPVTVSKPSRGDRPGRDGVSLKFADGRFSDVMPMTSAGSSGHGSSARDVMLDEASHIDELLNICAAVEPSAGELGDIGMISTANGRSNPDTGEGNHFHATWEKARAGGSYDALFLPYNLHPDRDEWWYEHSDEAKLSSMPLWKLMEQFPRKWQEAFALSDRVFFDEEALTWYLEHIEQPKYRFDFRFDEYRQAKAVKRRDGRFKMFREPLAGRKYAIMGDPASGHGRDSSAAYVIDLQTAELCVEYHAKVGEDEFARDLYWLGMWYGKALIGVETQGGNGTATVIGLRDGAEARPPYPKLYQHRNEANRERPDSKLYGMPMDPKNRNLVVNQVEKWVREKSLPFITEDLHYEMTEFVEHDHGTSPRARDGSHDDRVMACAGALDLFRRYGRTIGRAHRKVDAPPRSSDTPRREKETPPGFNESRYRPNEPHTKSLRRVIPAHPTTLREG